jgi:predicted CXXCH cytochrome family protein
MSEQRIKATYIIETPQPLQKAAEVMAGEQSTGTFLRVPGETDELRERHGARIESLQELDPAPNPSLPGSKPPAGGHAVYRRAQVVLSFPLSNMGPSLPNLVATVMGNLFELREFSGLKEKNAPVCYQGATYPYFFNDTNNDGLCGATEVTFANGYKQWTPRLLKASYNYQMATKDPGAFAHNAKYLIQLMHDSINALNEALAVKVDMAQAVRQDRGHFNGASTAARRWDADEAVTASCSRCHGGSEGFRFYAQYGVGLRVQETANGLDCATCHTNFGSTFDVLAVANTTFPSGIVRNEPGNDNLCSNCHSGRAAKATVDGVIASNNLRFSNVHYAPAAGVKLGTATKVGYEYSGKTYAGPLTHMGGVQCTSCHDPIASQHSFLIEDAFQERCRTCHADALGNAQNIRMVHLADYDGDNNTTEALKAELDGLADRLLAAMKATANPKICYAGSNPYFFIDTNGNGTCDGNEATSANSYKPFTPALLKAAFNYQLEHVEEGAWAHNFKYMGQLLYDSIADLGGNVEQLTRP